ncbi:MAG: hypothetical protein F4239_04230, partial [Gammaproteobacteria bacterium]|nr:hypothetical protein [Gammaproteobacteria bacterium]
MNSTVGLSSRHKFAYTWPLAWGVAFTVVAFIWIGGDLWQWAVKAPKELTWKVEALGSCTSVRLCVTGFFKFMVSNEAYIFPWTFKEFTRFVA